MISNQILQNTIDGLSEISKMEMAVYDPEGSVLATTMSNAKEYAADIVTFVKSADDIYRADDFAFFKVNNEKLLEYIVLAKSEENDFETVGKIAVFQIEQLMVAYREKFDKDNFVKNLLLDNLLLVDIYNKAKKLHVDVESRRVVIIVETGLDKEGDEIDRVRNVFGGKTRDFVTAVDEKNVIVIKDLGPNDTYEDIDKICAVIIDAFRDKSNRKIRIAYGTIVNELKEVSKSYKEAALALDVGKIFFADRQVIAYSLLGIGRLIYQLPIPLCKMFIEEIFEGKSPDDFDEETLTTINKFFENSLNVSETSRQLYIHRNTLVYRLDKLQKSTGLDLRVFEDAITFKIALMVVEYMNYMEDKNF